MDRSEIRLTTKEWVERKSKEGWATNRYIYTSKKSRVMYSNAGYLHEKLIDWVSEVVGEKFTTRDTILGSYDSNEMGERFMLYIKLRSKDSSILMCEIYKGKNHIAMAMKEVTK
jgi:hypothetical protein